MREAGWLLCGSLAALLVLLAWPFGSPITDERPLAPPALRDGPADATVVVGAPGGRIDDRVYSFNVASWLPDDFAPANETFVAMLRQLRPALLRFPAGHDSQFTFFDPTSSRTALPDGFRHRLTGERLDQFLDTTARIGAQPLLAVNLKTGSPAMAAELARHVVDRGHAGAWYELGNEPDLRDRFRASPEAEAGRFLAFAAALRAADPSARLVGGAIMTGANAFGANGREPWMEPFARIVGERANALSWHWYPLDSDNPNPRSPAFPAVEHLVQERASDWLPSGLSFADLACEAMEAIRAETGAEHWVTELGPDSGAHMAPGITNGQVAAVWIADALPRLAECGADAVFQFAARQHEGQVLALMTHDREPTPLWGAYQLLSMGFRGEWLACEVDGAPQLACHAARAGDGATSVVLANKGAESLQVALRWSAGERASVWTLEADGPTSTTARANGEPLTRELVLAGLPQAALDADAGVLVPPYGVVLILDAAVHAGRAPAVARSP